MYVSRSEKKDKTEKFVLQNKKLHGTLLHKEVVELRRPQNLKWKIPFFLLYGLFLGIWLLLDLPCVLRSITGVICPGCGMSRAWLALLQLDLKSAFFYHPMFWCVPLLALYILYDGYLLTSKKANSILLILLLGGFALCYVFRLIVYLGGNLTI